MGVPQFFSFLAKRYPEAISNDVPGRVSSLAFDLNSFFYRAAEIVYGYGNGIPKYKRKQREKALRKQDPEALKRKLFNTILTLIKNVVSSVQPQDTVIFAVDGMAPMAKIQQQRQRRYKSAFERRSKFFDTNAFSPGTDLMVELDEFLRENFKLEIEKGKRGEALWLPPKVIYSSHLVPGEGEQKIQELYRKGIPEGPVAADGGSHVIHGLDGDLIMLSMILPQKKVFLMREDEEVSAMVDIEILRESVKIDLGTKSAIEDFMVLMYFIGNDFLPRIKSMSEIFDVLDIVIDLYRKVGQPLSRNDGEEIYWRGLALYLQQLRKFEPKFVQKISRTQYRYPSHVIKNSVVKGRVNFPDFRNGWYDYALSAPSSSKGLADAFSVPDALLKPTRQQIVNMCVEFFTGMAWTSLYYRKGMAGINQEWSYPYFYAPLISDLAVVSKYLLKKQVKLNEYKAFDEMLRYNVVHQLLCIIPPPSNHLVPEEVLDLYLPQSPIIDMFPEAFLFDEDGKNADWQMHALVPHANIRRIFTTMNYVTFKRKTIRTLEPHSDFVYPKKGFGDPRKTIIQVRRTRDQIEDGLSPSVGQWGRGVVDRKLEQLQRGKPLAEVRVGGKVVSMLPSTIEREIDPKLKSIEERKIKGDINFVRFNPRGRMWKVRQDKQKAKGPEKSALEILSGFDMDYSELPFNL